MCVCVCGVCVCLCVSTKQMYAELFYDILVNNAPVRKAVSMVAQRMNLDLDKITGPGYDDIRVVHG